MYLSIIIPSYNNWKNLSSLLKNLKKQTVFNDLEIIIVDDGSKESSFAKATADREIEKLRNSPCKMQSNSEQLGIISQGKEIKGIDFKYFKIKHAGVPVARNFGFSKSSGEYIFFCDADVVFLKNNALEKMINKLEQNPEKSYCYCGYLYGWKSMPSFSFSVEKLKNNNYISTMSLIRRKALEKIINNKNKPFDENLKRFQDWDLWLTLLEQNLTGIWLPKILFKVKIGKISFWFPKIFYKIFKNNKKIKEFEKAKKIIQEKHKLS